MVNNGLMQLVAYGASDYKYLPYKEHKYHKRKNRYNKRYKLSRKRSIENAKQNELIIEKLLKESRLRNYYTNIYSNIIQELRY